MKNLTEEDIKKILEYKKIQELHYQNTLSFYIFRDTYRIRSTQRKLNLLRIVEIPSIVLTIINLYQVFFNLQAVFLTIFISFIIESIIIGLTYYYYVNKMKKEDESIMRLVNTFNHIKYAMDEVELIDNCKISIPDDEKNDNKNEIELHIKEFLYKVWKSLKFSNLSYSKTSKILKRANYDIKTVKKKLEKIKNFYEKKVENYQRKDTYKSIIKMIDDLKKKEKIVI